MFAVHMAILFSGIALLFNVDVVRNFASRDVMGLNQDMAEYIQLALQVSFMLALCMTAAAITRGLLIASKNTGAIAVSSVARVAAVVLVGAAALLFGAENGAMVGLIALTTAFAAESAVLGVRLWQLDRGDHKLFAVREPSAD